MQTNALDDRLQQLPTLLLPWFRTHARVLPWRRDREPYHVWLSEIMLQQTRVEAVKPYYLRFLAALPTIRALADCEEPQLLKLWEGLGYYSRARNLSRAAKHIMHQLGGEFPRKFEAIRALPGIGDYTAGAIASICFELPEPAVDGNVLRVITRICADAGCIDDGNVKRRIRTQLKTVYEGAEKRGDLTQALMELGATVCIPSGTPHCADCPCKEICTAHQTHTTTQYPVRREKKTRRIEYYTVFTLECEGRIATAQRPARGLLAGMAELPHLDGNLSAHEALAAAQATWNCHPTELISVTQRVHLFTHIEWHMTCVYLQCAACIPQFQWVTREELASETALPTAFRVCLPDFAHTTPPTILARRRTGTMTNVTWMLRPAVASDVPALVDLRLRQLHEAEEAVTCDLRTPLTAYFQEVLTIGSENYLVAEAQEQVIAFAGIGFAKKTPYYKNPTGKFAFISALYTLPEYRRMGIASELMRKQMRLAKARGCDEMYVSSSESALPLYTHLGFMESPHFRRIQL